MFLKVQKVDKKNALVYRESRFERREWRKSPGKKTECMDIPSCDLSNSSSSVFDVSMRSTASMFSFCLNRAKTSR